MGYPVALSFSWDSCTGLSGTKLPTAVASSHTSSVLIGDFPEPDIFGELGDRSGDGLLIVVGAELVKTLDLHEIAGGFLKDLKKVPLGHFLSECPACMRTLMAIWRRSRFGH